MTPSSIEPSEQTIRREFAFWRWFATSGLRSFVDWWLVVHASIGFGLAKVVPQCLSQVAQVAFLPLASILIGLAFAWGGNALAVLQTPEIKKAIGAQGPRAFSEYLFKFQQAILLVLVVLVVWGLLATGVGSSVGHLSRLPLVRLIGRAIAFGLTSIAIRECWHVVLGTQSLLIMRHIIEREADRAIHKNGG